MGNCFTSSDSGIVNIDRLTPVRARKLELLYKVGQQLGSGAEGVTYLVTNRRTGQRCAAKQLHGMSHKDSQRLRKQFNIMVKLRHPNITKVLQLLEYDEVVGGRPTKEMTMISEVAEGGDLYSYMRAVISHSKQSWSLPTFMRGRQTLTEDFVAGVFRQAMLGVAYLHDKGIVHGDLKPDNILMIKPFRSRCVPEVTLCDFGMAQVWARRRGFEFGDPRYQPPETWLQIEKVLRGRPTDSTAGGFQCDIWSMGVVLFELFSDLIPFWFERCSLAEFKDTKFWFVFSAVIRKSAALATADVVQYCPGISTHAVDLLLLLLDKRPDRRPKPQAVVSNPWFSPIEHALSQETVDRIQRGADRATAHRGFLNAMAVKLHRDHARRVTPYFDDVDTDRSGDISMPEFREAMRKMGMPPKHADTIFKNLDGDANSKIDFNEFAAAVFEWSSLEEDVMSRQLDELLDSLDADSNGTVSLAEFGALFQGCLGRQELAALLASIGSQGRDKVGKRELRAFLADASIFPVPKVRPRRALVAAPLFFFLCCLVMLLLCLLRIGVFGAWLGRCKGILLESDVAEALPLCLCCLRGVIAELGTF